MACPNAWWDELRLGFVMYFDGPLIVGYPPPSGGCSLIARERLGETPRGAGSSPADWSPSANVVSCPSSLSDGPLSLGYRQKRCSHRKQVQILCSRATG